MSHISLFEAQVRQDLCHATPAPAAVAKDVGHFFSARAARPTPRRFLGSPAPSCRRFRFSADLMAGVEEDENPDVVREMCGKTWTVHRCSPLFGFQMGRLGLEVLRRFIRNDLMASVVGSSLAEVRLGQVKGLRGHLDDEDAFRIEAEVGLSGSSGCRCRATVYLVSVDAREADLMAPSARQLPCVLTLGNAYMVDRILRCLEKRFDCLVARQTLPEEDLKWIAALWCGFQADERGSPAKDAATKGAAFMAPLPQGGGGAAAEEDTIDLKYRVQLSRNNSSGGGVDSVCFTFEARQIRFIWENMKNPSDSEMTPEQMERFHLNIKAHILKALKLRLDPGAFSLVSVKMPAVCASVNGQVRIERSDKVKTVLKFLTDLCQGTTLSATPPLAVEENLLLMDDDNNDDDQGLFLHR